MAATNTEDPIATLREAQDELLDVLDDYQAQWGDDFLAVKYECRPRAMSAKAKLRQATDALATTLAESSALEDRIRTILDEAVSMMPVMPAEEALTLLEEHVHSLRMAVELAQRREPTQAEGDAHARKPDGSLADECFVPAGGWTGRRCSACSRWVWGGPTACVGCADLAEKEARIRELDANALRWLELEVSRLAELQADADKAGNCYGDPALTLLQLIEMVDLEQRGKSRKTFRAEVARSALELMQARIAKAELRVLELDIRRRESRVLLHRLTKYVKEDRAVTPGVTRLARLTDQVTDYLVRTSDPNDVLRTCDPALPSEPVKP